MTKILVATEKPFAPIAIRQIREIIEGAGYSLGLLEKYTEKSELISALQGASGLIVRSDIIDDHVLNAYKDLKIVIRAGAGYDNIDLEASTKLGIVVMNTPGQNANAVAELALGMMVYVARNNFNGSPGTELLGKKLGIQAYGNVGKRVGTIAGGFGMEVYAYDPYVDKSLIEKDNIHCLADVNELYKICHYISVHIPANNETVKSINYDLLSLMPDNGILINTARKEVICEDSLLRVMEEKLKFKYASDVEPDAAAVFREKYPDRIYFTPKKMGAQTAEANINAGVAAARQIVNYLKTGDKTFQVN